MEEIEKFIETFVKIELLEDGKTYGYYPFSLLAKMPDDKLEVNSLCLGGDVAACYTRFKNYLNNEAKEIFMALDFPSCGDIEQDFVCVFSMILGKFSICAIPYSLETGERSEVIKESSILQEIELQFLKGIKK